MRSAFRIREMIKIEEGRLVLLKALQAKDAAQGIKAMRRYDAAEANGWVCPRRQAKRRAQRTADNAA